MLNKRQERIILLLTDHQTWKTGRQLSGILNVSTRTIRSDIEKINEAHTTLRIISDLKKGYCLHSSIQTKELTSIFQSMPHTMYQRCIYIIHTLLVNEWKYSMYDLITKMHISDICFKKDLQQIKKMLLPYSSLQLIISSNTLCLQGKESQKRQLYKHIILKEVKNNFLNLDVLAHFFHDFDILLVKEILETILSKYNYSIKATEMPSLLLDIGITMQRMVSKNYIAVFNKEEVLLQRMEYTIATVFFQRIAKKFFLRVTDEELVSFAVQLHYCRLENEDNHTKQAKVSHAIAHTLVTSVLQDIYQRFTLDFREDTQLQQGVYNYIQSHKTSTLGDRMYTKDMKRKYPFLFILSLVASTHIKNILGGDLHTHSLASLTSYFGTAMENIEAENKYTILLICPHNPSFLKPYKEKIELLFPTMIYPIIACHYFEEKKVIEIHPDLILTLLPLEHRLDILTVQLSAFIDIEEAFKIVTALQLLKQKSLQSDFKKHTKTMLDPRFFYPNKTMSTPKEILHFMSQELYQHNIVNNTFESALLERETISPTSFVYSLAVPHPIIAQSKQSKYLLLY